MIFSKKKPYIVQIVDNFYNKKGQEAIKFVDKLNDVYFTQHTIGKNSNVWFYIKSVEMFSKIDFSLKNVKTI